MDKPEAVAAAVALVNDGTSATKATQQIAEQAGVSPRTISRWAQDAGTPLGQLSDDTAKEMRRIAKERYAPNLSPRRRLLHVVSNS